ncbi:putative tRNA-splicing endonuclease subunit tsp-4 [Podospora fimiseda]|uniref:tRNA-splicing endonuclease subunit Sen34 n=1 Tax=Podospora fimiseda TaxID=252190 RepID=A0AAN7GZD1_9PEZI|nr:putative tRNA-splicing endonuclease subunit tsp-4 [Podospora fimiseda]
MTETKKARISRVGGDKYLVFDIEDVMSIRRNHGICAVLTGTMPQNPTQNLFLGLPIELRAEEVKLLVDAGAAYVVDELAEHLTAFGKSREEQQKYLDEVKEKRVLAQRAYDEEKERIRLLHIDKVMAAKKNKEKRKKDGEVGEESSLFSEEQQEQEQEVVKKEKPLPGITPTTSENLVAGMSHVDAVVEVPDHPFYPFYKKMNSRGYFTTPGLRFGGDYSVYPGDPFRFHAHYLANAYGWNEEIPMLDLVTSGRLGTAVKKSFLFGSEQPAPTPEDEGDVRMFCVEWAGM